MLRHIVRIASPAIRLPLLCVVYPLALLDHILAHPDKKRLLRPDGWVLQAHIFWSAWDGCFVP